jgi:hypothetical protein
MDQEKLTASIEEVLSSQIGHEWKQLTIIEWIDRLISRYPDDKLVWIAEMPQIQCLSYIIHYCTLKHLEEKNKLEVIHAS